MQAPSVAPNSFTFQVPSEQGRAVQAEANTGGLNWKHIAVLATAAWEIHMVT